MRRLRAISADRAIIADFRGLGWQEMRKYLRSNLVTQASRLASGVRASDFTTWGQPGIRAQLVDLRTLTLEPDFRIEAGSPGWTCAIPFSHHVCDPIDARWVARSENASRCRSAT